mmetsp:Transcript_47/g.154  ORF Transcript_47/g.154 Transcript_47/m.154 type:complete len:224 (+) Transcript_47:184-855(+)
MVAPRPRFPPWDEAQASGRGRTGRRGDLQGTRSLADHVPAGALLPAEATGAARAHGPSLALALRAGRSANRTSYGPGRRRSRRRTCASAPRGCGRRSGARRTADRRAVARPPLVPSARFRCGGSRLARLRPAEAHWEARRPVDRSSPLPAAGRHLAHRTGQLEANCTPWAPQIAGRQTTHSRYRDRRHRHRHRRRRCRPSSRVVVRASFWHGCSPALPTRRSA